MAKSQAVIDNFTVGPYEVDYKGEGDVNFRLRKGVDLYKYFGLKKDTVIVENKKDKPVKKAFEAGLSFATPRFDIKGALNSFGLYGSAKTKVAGSVYLNYGGMVAISFGHYNESPDNTTKDVLFEVGVPLAVEFANLDYEKSSLFASIGFTPAYYTTLSAKEIKAETEVNSEKKNGMYVAPRVGIGGYIPLDGHLLKIGLFGEYRISCSKEEDDILKQRIGHTFVGANIGYTF
ncbi:hypothetical protein [Xylanibacter muris]|uniref:Outer membrane protein beta-barrel domain-containing protein n=1 Tax=Xylanibacter muris TaxID=2736290 RepID=A0ABX2AKK5_9BACT|nr:hypothetical protein [Xylanibacter muris]NPD91726.1 hypothetical protein [Xylanibacter muris]